MEDELTLDKVMSRSDWILKLREIFYSLIEVDHNKQNSKVRVSNILRRLISLKD